MQTGYSGTFVISWSQTELDGVKAPPLPALMIGALWRWHGDAVRVDGPAEALGLGAGADERMWRRRSARMVGRLLEAAVTGRDLAALPDRPGAARQCFLMTDGRGTYFATVIEAPGCDARLVMFVGRVPPRGADLWVIHLVTETDRTEAETAAGVICFAPGTRILTPAGPRPIEDIMPGDPVLTKDNGPRQVVWTGRRRFIGGSVCALPHLRPIRIHAGAIGRGRPSSDLIVSPGHRMVISGRAYAALFSAPEVLIAARDLVDGRGVTVEPPADEVTYIHLMTEQHEIIWANGMETESFHPANAAIDLIEPGERAALFALMPELERDAGRYGDFVRPNLNAGEARIARRR